MDKKKGLKAIVFVLVGVTIYTTTLVWMPGCTSVRVSIDSPISSERQIGRVNENENN